MHFKHDPLEVSLTSRKSDALIPEDCILASHICIARDHFSVTKWLHDEDKRTKSKEPLCIKMRFVSSNVHFAM